MSNVKIEGVEAILSKLANTQAEMVKAGRKANLAGAQIVAEELRRNVPVGDSRAGKGLKDNVVISGNRTDSDTQSSYVAVGFPKGVSHRIHFPEFGTIQQKPSAFFAKTVHAIPDKVQAAMIAEVKKVLT